MYLSNTRYSPIQLAVEKNVLKLVKFVKHSLKKCDMMIENRATREIQQLQAPCFHRNSSWGQLVRLHGPRQGMIRLLYS